MMRETLLLTGASGFLGRNIMPLLKERYDVTSCGLDASDAVCVDLSTTVPQFSRRFDIVVHAAGLAHIDPATHSQRQAFFDVNYCGTVNLCRAFEASGFPRALIFISTVAVYGAESGDLITEDHPLDGTSPYAASNIQAEHFLTEWCKKHDVKLTILRPALMAGPDAPGNLGAMVHGIRHGYYANIAGGSARKSMLVATDIADLVPLVADKGGIYNVCDSHHPSYAELARVIGSQCGRRHVLSVPKWLAWPLAVIGSGVGRGRFFSLHRYHKLTKSLTFSNKLVCNTFRWTPTDVLTSYRIKS